MGLQAQRGEKPERSRRADEQRSGLSPPHGVPAPQAARDQGGLLLAEGDPEARRHKSGRSPLRAEIEGEQHARGCQSHGVKVSETHGPKRRIKQVQTPSHQAHPRGAGLPAPQPVQRHGAQRQRARLKPEQVLRPAAEAIEQGQRVEDRTKPTAEDSQPTLHARTIDIKTLYA